MIDVNGIAQGYSVDMLAEFMETNGINNYVVELGGEIRVKGRKPGNEKMKIGIEAPGDYEIRLVATDTEHSFSLIWNTVSGRGRVTFHGSNACWDAALRDVAC